jgi:hypothetical protein
LPRPPRWLIATGVAIVTRVTAATIIIPIVADANRRETSTDTLAIEEQPAADESSAAVGVDLAAGFTPTTRPVTG